MRLLVGMLAFTLAMAYSPLVNTSSAVLLVYEGFDYPVGSLNGQNGGLGFSNAWAAGSVVAGSLSYTDGNSDELPTTGNRALISGAAGTVSAYRALNRTYGVDATYGPGTYWVSFLAERLEPHMTLDENAARAFGFQLHRAQGSERLTAGRVTTAPPVPTTGWGLFAGGTSARYDEAAASIFDPSFVVMRINIADSTDGNNSDEAAMWINPNLTGPLGTPHADLTVAAGTSFDFLIQNIRLFAGNTASGNPYAEFTIDEIRIGTMFEDVAGFSVLVPGDTNGNGVVELVDLNPIRQNYRQSVNLRSEGDLTGDLFVDFRDFRQWKTAYIGGGGSLSGVNLAFLTAPEPSSLVMIVMALMGATGAATRRRCQPRTVGGPA
jgi:hypothetical protein